MTVTVLNWTALLKKSPLHVSQRREQRSFDLFRHRPIAEPMIEKRQHQVVLCDGTGNPLVDTNGRAFRRHLLDLHAIAVLKRCEDSSQVRHTSRLQRRDELAPPVERHRATHVFSVSHVDPQHLRDVR